MVPLLESAPGIQPVTVFHKLMEEHPEVSPGVRRTLERRIRDWKAENGPGKAVIFPQTEVPGRTGISDFTHMNALGVTICGEPSDHMLYHFWMPWSGFERTVALSILSVNLYRLGRLLLGRQRKRRTRLRLAA